MIAYNRKYGLLNVRVKWFATKQHFSEIFVPTVFYHTRKNGTSFLGVKEVSHTLEISLDQDVQSLHGQFIKSYRQQIRQSEEQGVYCCFTDDLEAFVEFFNDFAETKKIHPVSLPMLREMKDYLKISFAMLGDQILAAHSYILDHQNAVVRTFHSATKRLDDTYDKNTVGKANKLLHFRDMVYFKDEGFKTYDFGGIALNTENPELKGINNFKMAFGGNVKESINYYSCTYYVLRQIMRMILPPVSPS
ncbi:hypothetical protein [Flavihumibacter solisilvae]|uniref:BioF2-like acetyltransferase domain-containing protein n=1 Tax=Flavihumibacter solisilvae TaxID=1349421 RepID=A0A0C1IUY1_9BACT|nr:hypothetical protein [Flavihumibacter solisilvae]KIC94314.1 hypothetical protein OI18_11805 [Flavihumibacter solisilvae]